MQSIRSQITFDNFQIIHFVLKLTTKLCAKNFEYFFYLVCLLR